MSTEIGVAHGDDVVRVRSDIAKIVEVHPQNIISISMSYTPIGKDGLYTTKAEINVEYYDSQFLDLSPFTPKLCKKIHSEELCKRIDAIYQRTKRR